MTQSPRILTIMGSGETSPTMVKTHRENIAKAKNSKFLGIILDTPFGFQGNADEIAAKAIEYFKVSVNIEVEVASFRSNQIDALEQEKFLSKLDKADFIFSGPGSPTYALTQWRDTQVRNILTKKVTNGPGVVTFSSAAALTLGSHTIPVYEIYKVGYEPNWENGLNLLGALGIKGAIIPHFNNAEGGNHDTRFCYLGESRLQLMEAKLNPDESIYGIDEHTAIVIDLETDTVKVAGNGTFNIRNQGRQITFESGQHLAISVLQDPTKLFKGNHRQDSAQAISSTFTSKESSDSLDSHEGTSPLLVAVQEYQKHFQNALEVKDIDGSISATLELLSEIDQWQNETFQSNEMEQARAALRTMIVRIGEFASKGVNEPEDIFGPFVDLALSLRLRAREQKRWEESDLIRDELTHLGVEVRDIPGGSEWNSIGK